MENATLKIGIIVSNNLALFDFDGTLTTKDSLGEFIKFAKGNSTYYFGLVRFSPYFIMWKLGFMKNYKAKEKLFMLFFKDMSEYYFKKIASQYGLSKIYKIQRESTYKIFLQHIKDGDRVVVVSASMRCWLEPWTKKHNVELLSTELEFKDSKFSGKFATKNCHGKEKVNRIKELLDTSEYETIYAYGDSSGDKEMLDLANVKYYKGKYLE